MSAIEEFMVHIRGKGYNEVTVNQELTDTLEGQEFKLPSIKKLFAGPGGIVMKREDQIWRVLIPKGELTGLTCFEPKGIDEILMIKAKVKMGMLSMGIDGGIDGILLGIDRPIILSRLAESGVRQGELIGKEVITERLTWGLCMYFKLMEEWHDKNRQ